MHNHRTDWKRWWDRHHKNNNPKSAGVCGERVQFAQAIPSPNIQPAQAIGFSNGAILCHWTHQWRTYRLCLVRVYFYLLCAWIGALIAICTTNYFQVLACIDHNMGKGWDWESHVVAFNTRWCLLCSGRFIWKMRTFHNFRSNQSKLSRITNTVDFSFYLGWKGGAYIKVPIKIGVQKWRSINHSPVQTLLQHITDTKRTIEGGQTNCAGSVRVRERRATGGRWTDIQNVSWDLAQTAICSLVKAFKTTENQSVTHEWQKMKRNKLRRLESWEAPWKCPSINVYQ